MHDILNTRINYLHIHGSSRRKKRLKREAKATITLLVAGSEEDGAGLIADEAFRDAGRSGADHGRRAAAHAATGDDGGRADHLDGESVAVVPGDELVHLGEDRLPQRRLLAVLGRRRHGRRKDWIDARLIW
jgi:hypothetical protein